MRMEVRVRAGRGPRDKISRPPGRGCVLQQACGAKRSNSNSNLESMAIVVYIRGFGAPRRPGKGVRRARGGLAEGVCTCAGRKN